MKKNSQDAGSTLKELYKVIRAHSDYVKLSKISSEKVDTQKQKEKFFGDPWKFGKQVLDGVESSGEPDFSKETCEEFFKVNMWMQTETMNMNLLLDLNGHHFPKCFLIWKSLLSMTFGNL